MKREEIHKEKVIREMSEISEKMDKKRREINVLNRKYQDLRKELFKL